MRTRRLRDRRAVRDIQCRWIGLRGVGMPFSSIPEILEELKLGKPIVLVDDEDRENEGDLVYAAEKITPEAMNFILVHGRGTVCLALTVEQCERLRLHPQTDLNTA